MTVIAAAAVSWTQVLDEGQVGGDGVEDDVESMWDPSERIPNPNLVSTNVHLGLDQSAPWSRPICSLV